MVNSIIQILTKFNIKMKKAVLGLFFTLSSMFVLTNANGQTTKHVCNGCCVKTEKVQKYTNFTKGDNVLEVGLLRGNQTGLLSSNDGFLRHKVFLTNQLGLRSGFMLSGSKTTTNPNPFQTASYTYGNTNVGVSLGLEKRFNESYRLSPYFGGDVIYRNSRVLSKTSNLGDYDVFIPNYKYTNIRNIGSIGIRGVIGADYFITKNVFVGAEGGIGINTSLYDNNKTRTELNGATLTDTKIQNNKTTEFGTFFYGAKVGVRF